MDQFLFSLILAALTVHPTPLLAQPTTESPGSQITVEGSVYCDPCFNTGFSKYSYFMPGADVHIQCKLKADPPGTAEFINFSVNRTTDRNGIFKLEIPDVDGVDCVEGPPIQFSCQAILIRSSTAVCNIPAARTTTYQLSVKSKQANQCIYSFPGLSFRPTARNDTLCGKTAKVKEARPKSFNPNKVSLSHYRFPKPRFPLPKTKPPSFPFPISIPKIPRNPSMPFFLPPPPPPGFTLEDPKTWFPQNPFQTPPPPPPPPPIFNPLDPRTWPPLRSPPPSVPLNKKP